MSVRHNCRLDDNFGRPGVQADERQEIHRFLGAGDWFGGLPAPLRRAHRPMPPGVRWLTRPVLARTLYDVASASDTSGLIFAAH